MKKIPISLPLITKKDIHQINLVLKSGQLSQGEQVSSFEKDFAKFIGTKYAVATSNGTTALHLALLSLDLKAGDEVITTAFSFIASTNAILYVGAKPIFIDIGGDYNIDPTKIEEKITSKTKAILVVHLYGQPANMKNILRIAKKNKLKVIEDCAQAHGAKFQSKAVGSIGDVGCFSFYPTKNMTTIEGGMITTNYKNLAVRLTKLRNHGSTQKYFHEELGYNFRLTDVQGALGRSQLSRLQKNNQLRIKNAALYRRYLKNNQQIILPPEIPNTTAVYHQFTILTPKRNLLQNLLASRGIGTGIYYPKPIHKQTFIRKMFPKISLPLTEKFSNQVLSLPIHPLVTIADIKFICTQINKITKDF